MGSPTTVLVVDDSATILKVVSSILARNGYDVEVAKDGLAGIEMLKRGMRPDLILLDFVMPRMNGYQFCRELRSNVAFRRLPVVLMSAKGDKIRGQFVQTTGAVDAITKPFDARALVAVIEGALSKTAEGRARPVPEGQTMPEEETIADSSRPSQLPKQLRMRASIEVAQQVATALVPSLMELSDHERTTEAGIMQGIAGALTPDVLIALSRTLRDVGADPTTKEVLTGEIDAIPLAEVLQLLSMQRQTGVLRITSSRTVLSLTLRQGLIDFIQSRGAADEFRLGRYFVKKGTVTKDEIEKLLRERSSDPPKLVGDLLVEGGHISAEQLKQALVEQSSELCYDMLRWRYGKFSFSQEPPTPEADRARLALPVSGLILEGFRRVDEWRLMEGTINFDQVVQTDQSSLDEVGRDKLTRFEQMVLDAVDGQRTISTVVRESQVGSFDAIKIIYQFLKSRVLRARS